MKSVEEILQYLEEELIIQEDYEEIFPLTESERQYINGKVSILEDLISMIKNKQEK